MLKDITVKVEKREQKINYRGQCILCNRKSWRWSTWKQVEHWHKHHKCVNGLKTSKNGKKQYEVIQEILDNTKTKE